MTSFSAADGIVSAGSGLADDKSANISRAAGAADPGVTATDLGIVVFAIAIGLWEGDGEEAIGAETPRGAAAVEFLTGSTAAFVDSTCAFKAAAKRSAPWPCVTRGNSRTCSAGTELTCSGCSDLISFSAAEGVDFVGSGLADDKSANISRAAGAADLGVTATDLGIAVVTLATGLAEGLEANVRSGAGGNGDVATGDGAIAMCCGAELCV